MPGTVTLSQGSHGSHDRAEGGLHASAGDTRAVIDRRRRPGPDPGRGTAGGGLYLLEGSPGSGKTTLALQFLRAGATRGERTLLVAFSETPDELAALVASHGWSLDGIDVMDLSDLRRVFGDAAEQTLFHPSEIEFGQLVDRIRNRIDQLRPTSGW